MPAIREHAGCITYDHRGHGKSKAANHDHVTMDTLAGDLNELIRGLGLRDITLLGWSMGAGVCLNYMAIYGCDALRQVILCDMTPRQMNDDTWKLGLYKGKYTKEDMEKDANKKFYSLYKEFAIGAVPRLAKVPGFMLRRPLKKILAKCDESVLRSLSRSMKEKDFRQCVEKITVPVHYFYAVPGSLFSPDLVCWYKQHVHSEFHSMAFQDSTHMMIADHPDQFAREVINALEY
jgi:pimeloyl-ACP methyl ester carboxylesterase